MQTLLLLLVLGELPTGTHVGDVNRDGFFDSTDMIQIFQAGEYEDGIFQNSIFEEGDFNCDLEFDSSDLILAMQQGTYNTGIMVPEPQGRRATWIEKLFVVLLCLLWCRVVD